ncbi:MAG: SRPBCC domain-containing protein [Planctomycetota bacterium]|nr:SRPBCC domain-containing protein [Planctomycetota bacterium]
MSPNGLQITPPTDTTIVLTRTFNAPRRMVWEAMFTPETMLRWMLPPPGWNISVCECDARMAGALRLVWKSPDGEQSVTLYGVFTEAVVHKRLVHAEMIVLGNGEPICTQVETHEFAEQNGITSMQITQVFASKPARDEALTSGMECIENGFQKLDALLGRG